MKHYLTVHILFLLLIPFFTKAQTLPSHSILDSSITITDTVSTEFLIEENSVPENDEDDNKHSEDNTFISSLLTASRDPFTSFASFHFNLFRYRQRGYEYNSSDMYINGVSVKDAMSGSVSYNFFTGLNSMMRNREAVTGLQPLQYAFGNINGAAYVDMRASKQRKQKLISYSSSNTSFSHQATLSIASGLNKHGWTWAACVNARFQPKGIIPGTYYTSQSGYLAVDKQKNNHTFSFIAMAAMSERAKQGISVTEMTELAGDKYYNPYWGYQNGKMRNANITKQFQPLAILSHRYKMFSGFMQTSASFSKGKRIDTGLDWLDAPDPRADYYKNLPSAISDSIQSAMVYELFKNDINMRQINWQAMYDINRKSEETFVDASGENKQVHLSKYIVANNINKSQQWSINHLISAQLSGNCELDAGASFRSQRNELYKTVNDLLGGDCFINHNRFGDMNSPLNPSAIQYDLDNPDRLLHEGDKYAHDYFLHTQEANVWFQNIIRLRKVDLFLSAKVTNTVYWREGLVRNGLFPLISQGNSEKKSFFDHSFKAGATYKMNGRNYFFVNAMAGSRAPSVNDIFIAPSVRNTTQDVVESEEILSAEAGYALRSPKLKIQLTGYYTCLQKGMDVISFYHDDYKSFVNYSLHNIDKIHYGIEFGADYKIFRTLSLNVAASCGRSFYSNRANAIITSDNSAELLGKEILYIKNYRLPIPQEVYGAGITYRSPKFWMVSISSSYARERWLSFNPVRRSQQAIQGLDANDSLVNKILSQQKLKDALNVDLFASYSLRVRGKDKKKKSFIVFSASANNLLNDKNMISGGYEQSRFDFSGKNVDKFPAKYYYATGLSYYLSVSYKF